MGIVLFILWIIFAVLAWYILIGDENEKMYQMEMPEFTIKTYNGNEETNSFHFDFKPSQFKIVTHTAKNKQKYITLNYVSNGNVFLKSETYKNVKFLENKARELADLLNCNVTEK
jgi:uncharacterized ion transporter superfamily protein YfcC